MSYRPLAVVRAPVATRSGYGAMSRDIVRHLIEKDQYDVEIHSINWGNTPMNALDINDERDKIILDRIVPEQFPRQPDLYISISIPTEFRPMGRYNIGITAGIETTQAHVEWVKHMNVMDINFVISEHSKRVFETSQYQAQQNGQVVGEIKCQKPIEVLHNCVDTNIFKKIGADYELDTGVRETLDQIPESYNFLFVGHWLNGPVGHDRKNVGLLIKLFFELFKRTEWVEKPGLILKTSVAGFSLLDRQKIKERVDQIRQSVELGPGEVLPNVYVLHGDLTDQEMNSLYNHSKVKTHISLTKGEGFGRPLLEASLSGKPIITTGFSGQLDFLDPEHAVLLGGELEEVHESVRNDWFIENAKWLSVDPNMAATAMAETIHNYKKWKDKARQLMMKNRKLFSYEAIRDDFWTLLDDYVPEFDSPPAPMGPQQKDLKLPGLKKLTKDGPQESKPKVPGSLPKLNKKSATPSMPKLKKLT